MSDRVHIPVLRECAGCGAEFDRGKTRQTYCNTDCRDRAKARRRAERRLAAATVKIPCRCGAELMVVSPGPDGKFEAPTCRRRRCTRRTTTQRERPLRQCPTCGKPFRATRTNKLYCTPRCQDRRRIGKTSAADQRRHAAKARSRYWRNKVEDTTMMSPEYVRSRFENPAELDPASVTVMAVKPAAWADMAQPRTDLERLIGYQVIIGDPVSDDPDDGYQVAVLYSPERIAWTLSGLPMSPGPDSPMLWVNEGYEPDDLGSGIEDWLPAICYGDNYLRVVLAEINYTISHADLPTDKRLSTVVEKLGELHSGAAALLAHVQFAVLP